MAAARRDANARFAELDVYLQSRGIDPHTVDPGPRPSYNDPPVAALGDLLAPTWDGVDRIWDRDAMFDAIRDRFDKATPLGPIQHRYSRSMRGA